MHAYLRAANEPEATVPQTTLRAASRAWKAPGVAEALPAGERAGSGPKPQDPAATCRGDPDVEYLFRLRRAAREQERLGYVHMAERTRLAISRLVDVMCGEAR